MRLTPIPSISLIPPIPLISLILLMLLAPWFGAARADAAVTALVAGNQLVVGGDGGPNQITLRLFPLDDREIQVLDGNVAIGTFVRATFTSIVINAVGGNDTIVLSRVFGAITEPATIDGGLGDDSIRGGAGADVLRGGDGNDRIIWNPGDGSDLIEGGNGVDVLEANGSAAADVFAAAPNPSLVRVGLSRSTDAAAVDIGTTETLEVNALGGEDRFTASGELAGLISLVVDGGDDHDGLIGGTGPDILKGGNGDDQLQGGGGDDLLEGGPGNDFFRWNAGDGNDTVEGGEGSDLAGFFCDATSETVTITPNGARIRVTRNPGNFRIDLNDIAHVGVEADDGNDNVAGTNGLVAAGLRSLILHGGDGSDTLTGGDTDNDELSGDAGNDQLNGGAGDDFLLASPGIDALNGGAGNDLLIWTDGDGDVVFDGGPGTDRLGVNGSPNTDVFNVFGSGGSFTVKRTTGNINISGIAEVLEIQTLGGDDIVNVKGALATLVSIEIETGVGVDSIDTVASAVITVNGNSERDTLIFDALSQPISTTPSTLTVGGLTRVTHTQVESVLFLNLLGTLPAINITSPTNDPATAASTPFITLSGSASDTDGIASIGVTNDRGGSGTAALTAAATGLSPARAWTSSHVPLVAGANILTATVRDTAGNEVSDTLAVTVNAFTYTLAEGSTGSFFDTDILIANPNNVAAPVTITYLKGDGTTVPQALTLAPTSRTTIRVDEISGLENTEVSATVTSTAALPIVVERTMRWDATRYGAHTEKATDGPAKTWFFAEGSQGFFDTYVLLANPGPIANTATVTFLLENGAPVVKTFPVAPTSRLTVAANSIPEVSGRSFGIVVSFTEPGVAERAMYFGARQFDAGHESAGVNAPAASWFLAEGATGSFFTTFVLLANPGTADATATVTFLPDTGAAVTKTTPVPAGQRVTLNIATEDASLASGAIATAVQSTQPILVERAQYWPSTPDRWYEAHNAFGSTAVGTKWGLAEGRVGGPEGYQTFILLANADPTQAAQVRITFLRANGTTVIRTFTVNPTSRLNVQAGSVPELANESFGALIEVTAGASIFVERALYSDAQGVVFAAGTNALATRLP